MITKTCKSLLKANVSQTCSKTHLYSIAKPRYKRPCKHLTETQVRNLFFACEKAYKQNMPLNRFFTIHYDDVADKKHPQKFITSILEKTRKWLKYRGLPTAYVYTLENGKNKGIHVHLLLHIPNHHQRPYKRALKKWLPFEWSSQRIVVKPVKYPEYGELSPLSHAHGVLSYMCKGINPKSLISDIKPKNQGDIFGRRWGISKTLIN